MVWTCLPFIRSGQNHLARHSERGEKTRQTKEKMGRQHQVMNRPGVWQVPEGSGEQGKIKKNSCKIIFGAPMTLAVKELMMIMMMTVLDHVFIKHQIKCNISTPKTVAYTAIHYSFLKLATVVTSARNTTQIA